MPASTRQPDRWRRTSVGLALAALGVLVALPAAELAARLTRLDQRLMTRLLYFQGADVEVHRISADPALRYELAPNTSCDCTVGGPHYRVTIDENGARYPTHQVAKNAGTFRIMCVGGSTVYGGAVDDDETIPAALERRLNATAPTGRRYEAWNFGTSAYMLRQAAHLAVTRLDSVRPDLVVVQLRNAGRRALLIPPSYDALDYPWSAILADPDLYREQITYPSWLAPLVHSRLLRDSALARAIFAILPGVGPNQDCPSCTRDDENAARDLSRAAEARGIPVVYYSIPANRTSPDGEPDLQRSGPSADSVYPGLDADHFIDLFQPHREPAFYQVHPPPATLDEFARLLSETLRARGFIPAT